METNKILYISALASKSRINKQYRQTGQNPGFAVQKFSRLLVKGLQLNGAKVQAFSNPPNIGESKRFISSSAEEENGIVYKYVPYFNLPIIKHISIFCYTFFYVLFWGIKDSKNKTIICDALSISICMGALVASKVNGVLSIGVVTDIYGLMVGSERKSIKARLASKLNSFYIRLFNKYILLTEQMNNVVNPKHRPYMIMEALCDSTLQDERNRQPIEKVYPPLIVYAGGIYEKYGLKMLAEAFIKANIKDASLVYYGDGSYVEEFKSLCIQHPNIEYRGITSNEDILDIEHRATLLVNPRFSSEEFTKYSFPSKNMEYMVSGTPLLTTKLPGMPKEYYPYVFLFSEETIDGYAEALSKVLALSGSELTQFGASAQNFVLKNKNNIYQGQRIIEFINKNK